MRAEEAPSRPMLRKPRPQPARGASQLAWSSLNRRWATNGAAPRPAAPT
jgi:hypothetical protein